MSAQPVEVESRVDWLTATSLLQHWTDESTPERVSTYAEKMLHEEEARGNRIRHQSLFGFHGLASGQAFVGKSAQGYLFRLSGEAAAERWHDVYHLSTNVSRLDTALTIKRDGDARDFTRIHEQEARDYARQSSPRMKVTRIDSGTRGRTLNIGSRSSDAYGRIYDKGAESKRAEYQDCWRYEVEWKRGLAKQAASLLCGCDGLAVSPGEMSAGWFSTLRVGLPQCRCSSSLPSSPGRPTEVERSLQWFRAAGRGSGAFLIERGMIQDLLAALGLTADVLASAGYFKQTIMPHVKGD